LLKPVLIMQYDIYIDTIKVAKYRSGALHVCTHVCFIHRKTSMVINVSNQMK
jgi:hypothetical protein